MKFSNWSYKNKITLVVCIFAFIPMLALSYVLLKQSYDVWINMELDDEINSLVAYSQTLNQLFDACEQKAEFVSLNNDIRSFMQRRQSTLTQKLEFIQFCEAFADTLRVGVPPLAVKIISTRNPDNLGSRYKSWDKFLQEFPDDERHIPDQIINGSKKLWVLRKSQLQPANEWDLCLYEKIEDLKGHIGVVELKIPVSYLLDLYQNGSGSVLLVIFMMEKEFQLDNLGTSGDGLKKPAGYSPDDWFVIEEPIYNFPGKVQLLVPKTAVRERIRENIFIFIGLILVALAGIVVIIQFVSHVITKQLTLMIENINRDLKELVLSEDFKSYDDTDFRVIGQKIYDLIRLSREYSIEIQKYKTEKIQLELELLQARFDPHFLYNTLGTIKYLIGDPAIKKSIEQMIAYYRIVLSKGSIIIPISEELKLIENYVRLQQFTYNMDFRFDLSVQPEINRYMIIKHILQPIVENALMHGLKSIDEGGILTIKGYKEGVDIFFEITDNGPGIDKKVAENLLLKPKNSEDGYGLYNVQQRIQVYYGKNYGLHIDNVVSGGTRVIMRIPAVTGEKTPQDAGRIQGNIS